MTEVIIRRKQYLEMQCQYVVGQAGFSSSGTEERSKNPVSELGTTCNAPLSEENQIRIDSSPLKGCAAQPCLTTKTYRQTAGKGAATHGIMSTSTIYAVCNYSDELGTDFRMYLQRSKCVITMYLMDCILHLLEQTQQSFHTARQQSCYFSYRYSEIKQRISAGFSMGKQTEIQLLNNLITELQIRDVYFKNIVGFFW